MLVVFIKARELISTRKSIEMIINFNHCMTCYEKLDTFGCFVIIIYKDLISFTIDHLVRKNFTVFTFVLS